MAKIILVTGARGVGKTTALASIVPATKEEWEKVLVFDTENSWSDLIETKKNKPQLKELALPIGEYVRAYDRFTASDDLLHQIATGKLPWVTKEQKGALLDYHRFFVETMDAKLATGKFKYIFIDTIEPIEAALTAYVEANKQLVGWSGQRAYGRMETEGVRPLYENLIEGVARRGVEFVGITSHLRTPWVNLGMNPTTGREDSRPLPDKVEPGGRLKLLARISTLMVWLVSEPSNEDGAPAGIVLKSRLAKVARGVGGYLKMRRVLPARMPRFAWEVVQEYLVHPADFAKPNAGEVLTDAERNMISELLNDEQMKLMFIGTEVTEAPNGELKESGETISVLEQIRRAKAGQP